MPEIRVRAVGGRLWRRVRHRRLGGRLLVAVHSRKCDVAVVALLPLFNIRIDRLLLEVKEVCGHEEADGEADEAHDETDDKTLVRGTEGGRVGRVGP